jgi:hypothetical protein
MILYRGPIIPTFLYKDPRPTNLNIYLDFTPFLMLLKLVILLINVNLREVPSRNNKMEHGHLHLSDGGNEVQNWTNVCFIQVENHAKFQ